MRDADSTLGLVLLGGGVAAASALWSRAPRLPIVTAQISTTAWIHPVPNLGARAAVTSNGFRAHDSGDRKLHLGVDLFYPRRDARDLIAAFPPNTSGGSPNFFMPDRIPALAASSGVVSIAKATPTGNTVVIRHPNGWATYYTHLATLAVHAGMRVHAGQSVGTIGASPKDEEGLRHLHFELWKNGSRSGAVDPDPYLAAWSRIVIPWSATSAGVSTTSVRNSSLSSYRPVGDRGERYPQWVRNLRGASGVYVIRQQGTIVYVGSSVKRLYDTLTRHFQTWRRYKGYWRGQFAEGHDPGLTYDRASVEVAIKLTSPDDAHEEERRMIRRLEPRDNVLGQPELEDVPF